jgi:hypothetical protein
MSDTKHCWVPDDEMGTELVCAFCGKRVYVRAPQAMKTMKESCPAG